MNNNRPINRQPVNRPSPSIPYIQMEYDQDMQRFPSFDGRDIDLKRSDHRATMAKCSQIVDRIAIGNPNMQATSINRDKSVSNFLSAYINRTENQGIRDLLYTDIHSDLRTITNNIATRYSSASKCHKPQWASLLMPLSRQRINTLGFNISKSSYQSASNRAIIAGPGGARQFHTPDNKAAVTSIERKSIEAFLVSNSCPVANAVAEKGGIITPCRILNNKFNNLHNHYIEFINQNPSCGRAFSLSKFTEIIHSFKYFKKLQGQASDMCSLCNTGRKAEKEALKLIEDHSNPACAIRKHFKELVTSFDSNSSLSLPEKVKQTADQARVEKDMKVQSEMSDQLSPAFISNRTNQWC